jgi:hypothetical protein
LQKLLPLNLRYVGLVEPRQRLDLGAKRPEEITLTIVSEIQRVFAKSSGESLRETKISIHSVNRESTRSSAVQTECELRWH